MNTIAILAISTAAVGIPFILGLAVRSIEEGPTTMIRGLRVLPEIGGRKALAWLGFTYVCGWFSPFLLGIGVCRIARG